MIDHRIIAGKLAANFFLIFALSIQVLAQNEPTNPDFFGLPAGTSIKVRMDNEVNTESASVDDTFTVTVSEPVEIDGSVVLAAGAVIEGRVTKVKRASAGRKEGTLEVSFETLYIDARRSRAIEGVLERDDEATESGATDVLTVLGSAAAGGIIGGAVGGGKGALMGAGLGGGVGLGAIVLKKGSELRIRANEEFRVRLLKRVALPARGY